MNKPVHNLDIVTLRQRKERGFSSIITMIYLVLFIGGGALLYFGGLRPTLKLLSSTRWQKTACQIVSSGFETKSSTDSKTRRTTRYDVPVIVYAYNFNGSSYQTDRYNFWEISATDTDRTVIHNNPRGAQSFCLVNPANPAEAVFNPMLPIGISFLLFFGVGMVLAGSSGLIYDFRSYLLANGWWQPRRRSKQKSTPPIQPNQIVLESKGKPRKGFFYFLAITTLIWNSFCLLFLLIFFRQLGRGSTDFISIILPLLFGVFLTVVTTKKYLSFLAPQPVLTIHSSAVRLGEPFELEWKFSGRAQLVTDVQIFLEAYEIDKQAKPQVEEKKSSYKDKARTSLQVVSGWSNQQGKTTVTIPADNQPTMKDDNKEFFWLFRVTWGTQKKSDNQRKFSFTVWPLYESLALLKERGSGH